MSFRMVIEALGFTGRLLQSNGRRVAARISPPVLLGAAVLYVTLDGFFVELLRYLAAPSERVASQILGIVAFGWAVCLLLHSTAVAALTVTARQDVPGSWGFSSNSRQVWRVYAAYLRLIALGALVVAGYVAATFLAAMLHLHIALLLGVALVAGLFFVTVRCGFLLAPVACSANEGPILRTSWRISRHAALQIAAVVVSALIIGLAAQEIGEYLILSVMDAQMNVSSFVSAIESYRRILPCFILVLTVSYTLMVLIVVPASVAIHRKLTA